jgi:dCMP deaminase
MPKREFDCDISGICIPVSTSGNSSECVHCGKELVKINGEWKTWDFDIVARKKINRPTWEESFMYHAIVSATRSTCLKRQVGACLVRDNRIIASGYNGAPRTITSCLETGVCGYEKRAWENSGGDISRFNILREESKIFCDAVHAEKNAYNQCSLLGPVAQGCELYTTNMPCPACVRDAIIPNKTRRVVVWKGFLHNPLLTHDEYTIASDLLQRAKIPVEIIDLPDERIREIHQLVFSVGNRLDYVFDPNLPR